MKIPANRAGAIQASGVAEVPAPTVRLVEPSRTAGGTRLYSESDVSRLRRIAELLAGGLNLAGIAMVLDLEADNERLKALLADRAPVARQDRRPRG